MSASTRRHRPRSSPARLRHRGCGSNCCRSPSRTRRCGSGARAKSSEGTTSCAARSPRWSQPRPATGSRRTTSAPWSRTCACVPSSRRTRRKPSASACSKNIAASIVGWWTSKPPAGPPASGTRWSRTCEPRSSCCGSPASCGSRSPPSGRSWRGACTSSTRTCSRSCPSWWTSSSAPCGRRIRRTVSTCRRSSSSARGSAVTGTAIPSSRTTSRAAPCSTTASRACDATASGSAICCAP